MGDSEPTTCTIEEALIGAAMVLHGRQFQTHELPLLEKAFARFGIKPPSRDCAECATMLLELLKNEGRKCG